MYQVMVEELSQGWMELDPRITETYAEQSITMHEDDEYMSYLNHYVVQGDQHIPRMRRRGRRSRVSNSRALSREEEENLRRLG